MKTRQPNPKPKPMKGPAGKPTLKPTRKPLRGTPYSGGVVIAPKK